MSETGPFMSGFYNLGNTCYMNATFHMYSGITELVDYFANGEFQDPLGQELSKFWREYSSGGNSVMNLSSLREKINSNEKKFNTNNPQDSQEYVRYVYDTIYDKFMDCPLKLTQFELSDVENETKTLHKILALNLPPGTVMHQSITFDEIVDYNMQKYKIVRPPRYIVVNMVLDIDHSKHELDLKIDPNIISFTRHCEDGESAEYKMICAMSHIGKFTEDGHDICYMRLDDHWYNFNDTYVKMVTNFDERKFGFEYHYLMAKI